jgi:UDPglucose 6-dehydrogenase
MISSSPHAVSVISITSKNIVFSPEFYGTTIHAPSNLNFLILGGAAKNCSKVADLFHLIKPASFRIRFTTTKTAELVKYMENCFLGLKV